MGEAVFARRASGLVREASLLDTIFFGMMNNAVAPSVWWVMSSIYWWPGANLLLTGIIAAIMGICTSITWGILGGSMPRSGGTYVYNSRIIHPTIALAISFVNGAFIQLAWIWTLAPWIGEVGLPIFASLIWKNPEAVAYWTHGVGLLIVSLIVNVAAFLLTLLGLRWYFRVQNVIVGLEILAVALSAVIFMATPHQKFVEVFNSWAAAYGSASFSEAINLTRAVWEWPDTWSWGPTLNMLLPFSWFSIYGWFIAVIGGEVKNPRRNIFLGQVINTLISVILGTWCILAFQRMVGWDFFHVAAYIDNEYPDWWKMPITSMYLSYAGTLMNFNPIIGTLLAGSFIGGDFLWVCADYILFPRALFVWGMDMVGPTWFTDVHPSLGTPYKNELLCFILSSIAIPQYCFWPELYGAIAVTTLQIGLAFGVTFLGCAIFPFRKKVRDIWEASPYKTWKIGPIPVATIVGAVSFGYAIFLARAAYTPEMFTGYMGIWTCIYIAVFALGIAWYYIWKWYRAKQGIDITLAYKQLMPE